MTKDTECHNAGVVPQQQQQLQQQQQQQDQDIDKNDPHMMVGPSEGSLNSTEVDDDLALLKIVEKRIRGSFTAVSDGAVPLLLDHDDNGNINIVTKDGKSEEHTKTVSPDDHASLNNEQVASKLVLADEDALDVQKLVESRIRAAAATDGVGVQVPQGVLDKDATPVDEKTANDKYHRNGDIQHLPVDKKENNYLDDDDAVLKDLSIGAGQEVMEEKKAAPPPPSSNRLQRGGGDATLLPNSHRQPGAYQLSPGSELVRNQEATLTTSTAIALSASASTGITASASNNEGDIEQGQVQQQLNCNNPLDPTASGNTQATVGDQSLLSVAHLVKDNGEGLPEADPNMPIAEGVEEIPGAKLDASDTLKWRKKLFMVSVGVLVLVVGVTLLLVFLLNDDSKDGATGVLTLETAAPTMSTETYVKSLLPLSAQSVIDSDPEAPQSKALEWLLHDPSLPTYPSQRIQQRFALATLYHSTSGDGWWNNTRWLSYDDDECTWYHRPYFEDVELYMASSSAHTFQLMYDDMNKPCDQNTTGNYQHLWIFKNNLKGSLPWEELALLPLKSIALFENELDIQLDAKLGLFPNMEAIYAPPVHGELPSEIGLLTNLMALLWPNANIQGSLPTEIGRLTDMVYFMLSTNELTSTIPSEVGLMSSLEWLYLYGNNGMTGTLPSELGMATALKFLNLKVNQFTGSIPSELGLLSNMDLMTVAENLLTGSIPSELGSLSQIKQGLGLDVNFLTGTIPSELGLLTTLEGVQTGSGTYGLCVHQNRLRGSLPSELSRLSLLERLWVNENLLTGSLDWDWTGMTSLESFRGQLNGFSGALPLDDIEYLNQTASLLEWNMEGNSHLSGIVTSEATCGVVIFECSEILCGCDCDCPET